MATKKTGGKKAQIGFAIDAELRDDFFLLARLMPGNQSPAAYLRKLIREEVDFHGDLLMKAKEIKMTIAENEEGV